MKRLILRLLDDSGQMLGWELCEAHVPGNGALVLSAPVVIPIDKPGLPTCLSVHWVDVNVEVKIPLTFNTFCNAGSSWMVNAGEIIRVGPQADGLPPVTVRSSVGVSILPAGMGLVGTR